ncbi:PAS domain S-box protein [Fibrella sp. USSR17]
MQGSKKIVPKKQVLNDRPDVGFALKAAQLGVWEFNLPDRTIVLDERCRELVGCPTDALLRYDELLRYIHPDDVQHVDKAFNWALSPQSGGECDLIYRTIGQEDGLVRRVRSIGQVYFDEHGRPLRFAGIVQAMPADSKTPQTTTSEALFRTTIEQAPVAMALFSGPQFVIKLANERVLEFWGRQREQVINKPLFEALPESSGQGYEERLTAVYTTGERFEAKELAVQIQRHGQIERAYIDFVYDAFREADGTISGVTVVCVEVTDQVIARQKAEKSESEFRSLIEQAPVATCLFVGRDLLIELANQPMIDFWGKGNTVIGKPLTEVLPELEGQPFLAILSGVFDTGAAYHATAAPCELVVNGVVGTYYFNFTYQPIRNDQGEVYAIMDMAVDVTEQVLARNRLVESEAYFRQLSDNVPAMIWTTQLDGYCNYLNKQWYDFTGQTQKEAEGFGWLEATHPDDAAEASRLFIDANERQVPFFASYRLLGKDGLYRWVLDRASPRFNAEGVYEGMIGTVIDVHEQKLAEVDKQKLLALVENSGEFIGLAGADGTVQYGNLTAIKSLGWTGSEGRTILDCVYAEDKALAAQLLQELMVKGHISHEIRFVNERTGEPFWIQWNSVAINDPVSGELMAIGTVSPNIDERKRVAKALEESEAKLRSLIANAPAGIGLFVGRDLVVEMPNQVFIDIVGKGPDIVGKPLREVMPELANQPFLDILDTVYTTGQMYQAFGSRVDIVQRGVQTSNFYNITYSPLLDANGEVYAILDIAIDATEQVRAQKRLEESELFARSIIDNSPIAKAVFVGEYMVIKTVNERMLEMLGRDSSIIGQPFMAAIPELMATAIMNRLQHVLATGDTIYQPEEQIEIVRFGKPYVGYYNYIYKALSHTTGERYGVLVTATEVTDQVVARQKIEESEKQFRALMEAIPAIAWTNSPSGEMTFYNQRLCEYTGLTDKQIRSLGWKSFIHPHDLWHSMELYQQSLETGQDYVVENRYRGADGSYRWHLNRAVPLRDETGKINNWVGTATDIHEQKQQEAQLEQQVEARTRQLNMSIQDLQRSNDNLQQFAYIASHDLQEPLRKIQTFSALLKSSYADELGQGADYLVRMQSAASRMSTLIKDLLTYSRISTRQQSTAQVSLNAVVQAALVDLDLAIEETKATIDVGPLPTIQGDATQLSQLFQNLLSNALKFRRVDEQGAWIAPLIRVSASRVALNELPTRINLGGLAAVVYHRLDVADNGIGFDEKYVERIFQVFQRLHGKSEFAGTGIGLAICEKVAANHGGVIHASGKPGEGATFSVYFPVTD